MPTYPKPMFPIQPDRFLDELAAAAETLDLELPEIDEARAILARADEHVRERARVKAEQGAAKRRITAGLVDGELDPAGAAEEAARIDAIGSRTLAEATANTRGKMQRRALDHIGESIDGEALFARCREIVTDAVTTIAKLRSPLAGIESAEQAAEAGTKQAKAWADYLAELRRFHAAHELVRLCRTQHWIKPLPYDGGFGPAALDAAYRSKRKYADVEAIRKVIRHKRAARRPFLELLDPDCDAAGPGGPFTEQEIAALRTAEEQHEAPSRWERLREAEILRRQARESRRAGRQRVA